MSLKGKTAVITGSNSGIGLGVAHELARAGADVVINSFTDRDEDHALAAEIAKEHGVTVRYIQADMSKPDQCRALIEQAGACDILVNNAGIQHVAPIDEFPTEKWDHGVLGMTKTVGLETAKEPITCNAVCPGYVLTPLVEAQIPDTAKQYDISEDEAIEKVILAKQPSKEFVTVEQLAGTVLFLCSPAADQITGTSLAVDGGWTAA